MTMRGGMVQVVQFDDLFREEEVTVVRRVDWMTRFSRFVGAIMGPKAARARKRSDANLIRAMFSIADAAEQQGDPSAATKILIHGILPVWHRLGCPRVSFRKDSNPVGRLMNVEGGSL